MLGTTANDATYDEIEQTAAALDAGVTSMYPRTAMEVIERWENRCRAAGDDLLLPVATGLAALRDELGRDRLDGRAIGRALLDLAEATTAVASQTDDARLTPKLERIASGLNRAGASLGGDQT